MSEKGFIFDRIVHVPVYWAAKFSIRPLIFFGISPNQVTFYSGVLNFILAAFCFAQGTYWWNIAGLVFLLVHYYFDAVDGTLARATGKTSRLGRWLDLVCDYLGTPVVFLGIGIGLFKSSGNAIWLIFTCLIFLAKFGLSIAHVYFGNSIYSKEDFSVDFKKDKLMTKADFIIKEFVLPESFVSFILYNIRYFLLFSILINQLGFFIITTVVLFNLRWIILLWVFAKVLQENKNENRIFKLVRKHIDGINFE